jgi:hypothetical protein
VQQRRNRLRLYAALALAFFGLALAGTLFGEEFNFIFADGRAYYVYLPSAVIDHDLDFTNEVRDHMQIGFRPLSLRSRTTTGLVKNKYPIGFALALLPAFLLAHGLALSLHALTGSPFVAPDGFSVPYQCLCLAMILAYAVATMAIADRWLTERLGVDGRSAAAAVCAFWIGTHYSYYSFREAFMVHVVSAFWASAVVAVALAARERLATGEVRKRDLLTLAFALSMAVECRPSNLFVFPILVDLALEARRRGLLGRVARSLPAAVPGLFPFALQILVWRIMTGKDLVDTYPNEGFRNWAHPYLLQTLFSSNRGLFFWSPLLLLSAWGILGRLRQGGWSDPLLRGLALSFFVLWYANSSWYAWWFGEAFGARAFLEISVLFVLGLGCAFERTRLAPRRARVGVATFTALAIAFNWALMLAFTLRIVPRQGTLF